MARTAKRTKGTAKKAGRNIKRSVPSEIYSKQYYLNINDGGALKEQDNKLSPRLEHMMNLAKIKPDDLVLDIGCGTGELCFSTAKYARTIGIDYSADAIAMCDEKRSTMPKKIQKNTQFIRTDVKHLKKHLKGEKATIVFMTDVVEHLYPEELNKLFIDLKPILAQDAKIYIHTAPNLEFYKYGYPVIRFTYPLIRHIPPARAIIETKPNWKGRKSLPKDPEEGSHNKLGHVNEQTPKTLRNTLNECGYDAKIYTLPFLRGVYGFKIRMIYAVLSIPGLKKMFGAEIVAIAVQKEDGKQKKHKKK